MSGRSWLQGPEVGPASCSLATPPTDVVSRLNRFFQMQPGRAQFFTMIYGLFEPSLRRLRYVAAGHPPIILVPSAGKPQTLPTSGIPVGMLEETDWEELTVDISPGDRLYVYTDGVIEATCEQRGELAIERLVEMLAKLREQPLQESVDSVRADVEAWCGTSEPSDDVTILALELQS